MKSTDVLYRDRDEARLEGGGVVVRMDAPRTCARPFHHGINRGWYTVCCIAERLKGVTLPPTLVQDGGFIVCPSPIMLSNVRLML